MVALAVRLRGVGHAPHTGEVLYGLREVAPRADKVSDHDLGFGRCARCGKWAVVGLQDVKLCQEHFDADLSDAALTPYVVHKREPHDVYVGRPTKWGNPFVIGKDGTREAVVKKYRQWLLGEGPDLPNCVSSGGWRIAEAARRELRGKVLGCWCAPLPCHGDVLAEVANAT